MDSRERNGDAQIPGLIVITCGDVYRAVTFVPPDWRVGAGANLERAPLNPVRLLDARELPELIGGGPNVQFPRLALQLDQPGIIDIIASLDGHRHHGLILAATTTWDKPNVPADLGDRARSGHGNPGGKPEAFEYAAELMERVTGIEPA